MSIKTFHIIFVVLSTLLALGLGFWGLNNLPLMSVIAFPGSVALIFYGIKIFKKFQTLQS